LDDEKSPLEELKTPLPLPMRAPWVFSSLRRRRRRRWWWCSKRPRWWWWWWWSGRRAKKGGEDKTRAAKKANARTPSHLHAWNTPKKPCFRPRKRGKKREKERYKTSLFVTRTWYNSAHIIMSTECTEAAFKLTPLAGNGAIGSREYYTLEGSDTACTKQASCVSLLVFFSRRNPPI
jgi:hypothetical protein